VSVEHSSGMFECSEWAGKKINILTRAARNYSQAKIAGSIAGARSKWISADVTSFCICCRGRQNGSFGPGERKMAPCYRYRRTNRNRQPSASSNWRYRDIVDFRLDFLDASQVLDFGKSEKITWKHHAAIRLEFDRSFDFRLMLVGCLKSESEAKKLSFISVFSIRSRYVSIFRKRRREDFTTSQPFLFFTANLEQ